MKVTQKPFNIKLSLFILAMTTIVMIFWVNRIMINQLRNEARVQAEHLAKSYSDAINSTNQEDIRFVMDILLPSMNFPIIITSKDEISAGLNLEIYVEEGSGEYKPTKKGYKDEQQDESSEGGKYFTKRWIIRYTMVKRVIIQFITRRT